MEVLDDGDALQRVQTQYSSAITVQKPRVLAMVERKVLEEAALIGAAGFYAWGAGKNHIEGPSKGLSMVLVRLWGNCAVEMQPVQESRDAWIFTAAFVDLETGFTLQRQFRQSKRWTIYGNFDEARKDDIRFQIGQSKAVRNVVLNALPVWLTEKALDRAKGGVREQLEGAIGEHGMDAVQAKAIRRLEALHVPEADVLRVFDRPTRKALTVEDLVILLGNISALESGTDTAETMFPPEQQRPGRERGELKPGDLKPSAEPNRGHDKEGLDKVKAATDPQQQPTAAPSPEPQRLTCPKGHNPDWDPAEFGGACPVCKAEGKPVV